MNQELKRKSLHIIAAAVPVLLIYPSWKVVLLPLAVFTILNIFIDLFKKKIRLLDQTYQFFFGDILRDHETKGSLTGSTYFFISLTFSYVFFGVVLSMPIRFLATIYTGFMIGDASAALVGKNFGRLKIFNNKTLEGTLAFWAASCVSTFWIMPGSIHYIFLFSMILAVTELVLIKLDDNFFVPLITVIILYFFYL